MSVAACSLLGSAELVGQNTGKPTGRMSWLGTTGRWRVYVAELTRGEAGTRDLPDALEGRGEWWGEGEAGEEGISFLRSRKGDREERRGLAITEFW